MPGSEDIVQHIILNTSGFTGPMKDITKLSKKSEDQFKHLEKEVTQGQRKMSREVTKGTASMNKDLKKNEDAILKTKGAQSSMIREFRIFGISIGQVIDKVGAYVTSLNGLRRSIGLTTALSITQRRGIVTLTKALGGGRVAFTLLARSVTIFKAALVSTGIGAIVLALGGLIAFLSSTNEGMLLVKRGAAQVGAGFDVLKDKAIGVGRSIVDSFSNGTVLKDFGNLIKSQITTRIEGVLGVFKSLVNFKFDDVGANLSKAFLGVDTSKIVKDMREAAAAADALAIREEALIKVRRNLGIETAFTRAKIEEYKKVSKDVNQTFADRERAAVSASELESNLLEKQIEVSKEELAIIKEKNALSTSVHADTQKEADAEIALNRLKIKSLKKQQELQLELNAIRAQEIAFIQKAHDNLSKITKEMFDIKDILGQDTDQERFDFAKKEYIENLKAMKNEILAIGVALKIDVSDKTNLIDAFLETVKTRTRVVELEPINLEVPVTVELSEDEKKKEEKIDITLKAEPTLEIDDTKVLSDLEKFLNKVEEVLKDTEFAVEFFSELNGLYQEYVNFQITQNQRVIDQKQEQIDKLQEDLEYEQGLKDDQLANSVGNKEEELAQLLEQQETYQSANDKLREDAQRKQVLADTVQQGHALVTASINIIRGFTAAIPIFGLGLGIAAVGTLFSFFAKSKISALKATKLSTGTAPGKSVSSYFGYADEHGDTDLNGHAGYKVIRAKDGHDTGVVISGREQIIPEHISAKYSDFFEAIKGGNIEPKDIVYNFAEDSNKAFTSHTLLTNNYNTTIKKAPPKKDGLQWVSFINKDGISSMILLNTKGKSEGSIIEIE